MRRVRMVAVATFVAATLATWGMRAVASSPPGYEAEPREPQVLSDEAEVVISVVTDAVIQPQRDRAAQLREQYEEIARSYAAELSRIESARLEAVFPPPPVPEMPPLPPAPRLPAPSPPVPGVLSEEAEVLISVVADAVTQPHKDRAAKLRRDYEEMQRRVAEQRRPVEGRGSPR